MNLDKRLLRLARQSRSTLALTIGLGFFGGVFTVLQALFLSRVVGQVFLEHQDLAQVRGLLVFLLAIIVLRAGLAWGSEVSANAIAMRVKANLRRQLFDRLVALGPAYAQGERTGELANTAVEGIEALDAYFSQYLPQLILAALVPLICLVFVLLLDPLSGIVLLVTAPLIPIFMILIGSLAQVLTRRQWQSLSRMSAYFLDVLQGLTTLKILGRSRAQAGVIALVSERFRETTMSVLRVTFLSALALEMISTLSTAVVAVEVGLRLLYGQLSFEQTFFVLLLAPEFYLPLRLLGARFHAGMSGVAAAKRIFEILDQPATNRQPASASQGSNQQTSQPTSHPSPPPSIQFDQVAYTYPDGRPALHDVSFEIGPGQKIALVGPSGAGKSTIANLLLRFITPDRGCIRVSGRALDELTPDTWREQVAWVPQQPYLFHGTLIDNIRLARPQASQEEIARAARLAHADEFIERLPQGFNTMIGERGARLSGGQAQRIALARAFLKDAPVLILDEATANLDPENESLVQDALQRLLEGRTSLTIAHRLDTVRYADRIIVLQAGQVAETGAHAALLARGGLYWRLVEAAGGHPIAGLEPPPNRPPNEPTIPPPTQPPNHPTSRPSHPILRLLHLIAPFTGLVALSALLGFATIGSSIGLMAASAYIIASAALHPSIAALEVAIVGVRFFGIARGLFRYLERYVSHQVTFRLLARLRVWFYQALEPLAPARLLSFHSGDLLARILGDIGALENFYVRALAPPLVAGLVALVMGIFMAGYHPDLAWALLAFLGLAGIGIPLLAGRLGHLPGSQVIEQRAALHNAVVDGIQGLADLLAYGQAQRQAGRVEAAGAALAKAQRKMARLNALQTSLGSLLSSLGMWVVLVLAIPLVSGGQISGVSLAVLTLAALTSFEAVLPLPAAAQTMGSSLAAARRLFEVVDAQPEICDPQNPAPLPDIQQPAAGEAGSGAAQGRPANLLEVRHLSFAYPDDLPPGKAYSLALADLSFNLPLGGRLAVVGPSGAGKTTLVNLLLRFWEYEQGQILFAGRDLRCYNQEALRGSMAVISQNTYLFNATLRENLLLARPKATQAEIERAVEQAQLLDFIRSLPQGYGTWIGEQGLRLSGGERQRLAIARALLKDAPLLILDEATANLDALTEREVLRTIEVLTASRTTLTITHRLAGLERMEEILVLREGRVVERGCHAGLLAQGGVYRRIWELQSQPLE